MGFTYHHKLKYGVTSQYYFQLSPNSQLRDLRFEAVVKYQIHHSCCEFNIVYVDIQTMDGYKLSKQFKERPEFKSYFCVCTNHTTISKLEERNSILAILNEMYKGTNPN